MKKTSILAVLLLALCASAFAQDGKRIYNKYSDNKGVSAVYISPAMFKLMGKLPEIDVAEGDIDLTPVIREMEGMYLISIEDSKAGKELKLDAEKMVKNGRYELLMEAKEEGEAVEIYVISDDGYVTSLVLIASDSDETTFIALDGKIKQEDLEILIQAAARDDD